MKKVLLLMTVLFGVTTSFAQKIKGSVKGTLVDAVSVQPLPDATVSVSGAKDSSLLSFTLTSGSGFFEIKNLDSGAYYMQVSYQGFETLKKSFSITAQNPSADLGQVKLQQSFKTLSEVVVKDDAPVKVKGDTLAFNADAFKTKPNATVEDLLKKLPGVQVDKEGAVKTQGEDVQKIYVDGKEFFGNDPKLATKNLTADMIDQVEVFDDVSEQSKFNKIDDGSRTKAINLKLKKDKKKGVFGRANAGYGTNDRYDAGVTANFFKGSQQVSLIGKANNTNNIGFTVTDMVGVFGGGGMQSVRGGGSSGAFSGGSGSGITANKSAGVNYRDLWGKNFNVNGSYFFNTAGNNNLRDAYRQTFYTDSTINSSQQSFLQNTNNNHRFHFNVNYTIDSFNSIIYTPSVNVQSSESFRIDTSSLFTEKKSGQYKLNDTRTVNDNSGDGVNWSNNLVWRRLLSRQGRTLSLNLSNTYARNDRHGVTSNNSNIYNASGARVRTNNFQQQYQQQNNTDNYAVSLSYTEPLSRDKILEFNYGYTNNQNTSNRGTFDLDTATGKYDLVNTQLTNHFENKNESNRVGTNLRIVKKRYNYQLGVAVQRTLLESDNRTKSSLLTQRYTNLFPTASFNYQFARSRSLRFNYRGRTNQPSITQLQDVLDATNPLYLRRGNPALGQEFSNNLTLNYNFFDIVKFRNVFASVSYNNTYNKIVDSIGQLPGGAQLITPANMDGVYGVNAIFNVGFPIKKMKGGNFNTNTRMNFNRNGNFTDGIKNYIKNMTLGEDLRLSYNYKEKLDLGVAASVSYTAARYTIQKQQNTSYFTYVYSVDATYTFPKDILLSTDFDYTANTGRSAGFNQNYMIWNGGLAKEMFKSKRGELKLSVFDILNQNKSVTRNVGENYVEDVQNLVLRRFFMLTFTYKLNRMGGKTMPASRTMDRAPRIGHMN